MGRGCLMRSRRKLTLTVAEAGKVLGISRAAAYRAAQTGELPGVVGKIGKRIIISRFLVERYLQGNGNTEVR